MTDIIERLRGPSPSIPAMRDAADEIERLRSALAQSIQRVRELAAQDQGDGAQPDDIAVDAFAAAMKAKLAEARAKGRGGWQDKADCPQQRLSDMLRAHVLKGDPRDVANFCMFLHQRGEAILPVAAPGELQP